MSLPLSDDRAALKSEQLERIKQRDTFLNLNIVAIGAVTAIAVQGQKQAAAWLVVPWLTAILGWAYLSNDDKVTAIARHLKGNAAQGSWETSAKGLLPPALRRVTESIVFVLSFLLPTPVAITLYANTSGVRWGAFTITAVIVEAVVTLGLGAVYLLSVRRRTA